MKLYRVDEFDEGFISEKLLKIYDRASEWIWFSTNLHPAFFNRDDIREKLLDRADSGVTMNILVDREVNLDSRKEEVEWVFNHENIQVKQSRDIVQHRVISDKTDLRLEKDHDMQEKGAANLIAMNAAEELESPYRREFEDWWESAQPVE